MSSFLNTTPAATYKDLLQVSYSNSGITSTLRDIQDGGGTASKLQLSTTAVNINAVGALQISGDTVGATAAEFNVLSGVTAGTALASKAVVLDANKKTDYMDIQTTFKLGGTTVGTTAAELNVLSGVTAGTALASKAVVLDSSKQIDEIDIKTTFQLNNVTVSSTAAELNYTDVTTIGTTQASKAVVLSANKGQDILTLANAASAASTIATDHSVITAVDDGSNVHVMATKDDNGTETVVKIAEQSSITNLSSGGAFYSGDGTDDYITIADNANLQFGTGNFGLIFKNLRLSDYTPGAAVTLARKANAGAENLGWIFTLEADGKPQIAFGNATNFTTLVYKSATAINATNGTTIHLAAVVTRETASVAGSVKFYQFGYDTWKLLSSVAITAGTPQTVTETTPSALLLFQNINGTTEYAFQSFGGFIPCNFAPTYAEVKEFIEKGIPAKYQWGTELITGDNSTLTSDTGWWVKDVNWTIGSGVATSNGNTGSFHKELLIVGKNYKLSVDVVVNSGTLQVKFGSPLTNITTTGTHIVTGECTDNTTINLYSITFNGTIDNITLIQTGAVAAYLPQNMTASTAYDASSNNLDGSVVGATLLNAKVADAFVNPSKAAVDDDVIATVKHSGYDSAGNLDDFVKIETIQQDVTTTDEAGGMKFSGLINSAFANWMEFDGVGQGVVGDATLVFNEDAQDIDFRVEGVGAANALFVQGSDGNVGIGTTTPNYLLSVDGTCQITGATTMNSTLSVANNITASSGLTISETLLVTKTSTLSGNTTTYGTLGVTGAATLEATSNFSNIYPRTDDTYYLGKNSSSTPFAWKGVILADVATADYYRIEVSGGTVVATQL